MKGPACGKEAVYVGLLLDRSGAFWSPNAALATRPHCGCGSAALGALRLCGEIPAPGSGFGV
jgi:hypothetical protein